jgi:hypothetical protein
MKRQVLILIIIFALFSPGFGQKRSLQIGGKLVNEIENGGHYSPGIGVQTIFKFTKHSGIESGLLYNVNPKFYMISQGLMNYSTRRYDEKVIYLPLLYRFESRLVNFTAGFALEYFLNMKQTEKILPPGYTSEFFTRLEVISTISLSKSWNLGKSWIIEPELRTSAPIPQGGVGTGVNISLRKRIR